MLELIVLILQMTFFFYLFVNNWHFYFYIFFNI